MIHFVNIFIGDGLIKEKFIIKLAWEDINLRNIRDKNNLIIKSIAIRSYYLWELCF